MFQHFKLETQIVKEILMSPTIVKENKMRIKNKVREVMMKFLHQLFFLFGIK